MPKDVAELDKNEYIFGEQGGRGTPASTFFKKFAHLSPKQTVHRDTSTTEDAQQKIIGAGRSHAEHIKANESSSSSKHKHKHKNTANPQASRFYSRPHSSSRPKSKADNQSSYFDLDDDWDTNFDEVIAKPKASCLSNTNFPKRNSEPSEAAAKAEIDELNSVVSRIQQFRNILSSSTVDISQLQKASWRGVPPDLRPQTWMHLLGYLPPTFSRREQTLKSKRQQYLAAIDMEFKVKEQMDHSMWHQISIDVPRTNPHIKLYSFDTTKRCLERILYIWAVRHPASGYVQGINDLVTPFFQTFLQEYVGTRKVEDLDPSTLTTQELHNVEADSYWCLSKLLDGIQDNYIHAQPGIHRQVSQLEQLVSKIDSQLSAHFASEGLQFMQFSFRWMNCLLMREVPMQCAIRIWDTYLSEGPQGFSTFHVYVCAAFLLNWANELRKMEFQDLIMFLQSPPTTDWTEKEIELILSQAFTFQAIYK